ncbi:hypothetical protein DIPPA_34021 [Diplonema papillatum]|nr:hypothetical protein DIPPA_34021 [Diplonema papillatum]
MNRLNEAEIQRYKEDGFIIPKFKFDEARIARLREHLDELMAKNPGVRPEKLVNAHVAKANAEGTRGVDAFLELAKDERLLDLVESVLGPDIVLWGCHAFCKPAGDGMEVPWHQDGHYWPIRPLANCTVWVALDDSVEENGCLQVVKGSHKEQRLFTHHRDQRDRLTLADAVDEKYVDPSRIVNLVLEPGQMSMHDVYMIHGSSENRSTRRRAGIAIRYMPATSVFERKAMEAGDDSGLKIDFSQRPLWLVRGKDASGKNDFEVGH